MGGNTEQVNDIEQVLDRISASMAYSEEFP
jgi:hypothetical protein